MEFVHETVDLGYEDLVADTRKSGRTYSTPDGTRYPSITTVLSILSEEAIAAWRKRVGEETANKVSTMAARRGTQFHQHVEDYLRKEKEFIEFENILQEGMFRAIRPILDEIVPLALEAPMYSTNLKMAGRVDCVGMFEGNLAIIDFKSSAKMKEAHMAEPWFLQMTAYAIMVEELTGHEIEECMALVAVEGANSFQVFVCDPKDYVEELYSLRKQYENLYGI